MIAAAGRSRAPAALGLAGCGLLCAAPALGVLGLGTSGLAAAGLSGVIGHVGPPTVRTGLISGALCWLGFVATTLVVNNTYAKRRPMLSLIDGGHWLAVLLVQGTVIGWLL